MNPILPPTLSTPSPHIVLHTRGMDDPTHRLRRVLHDLVAAATPVQQSQYIERYLDSTCSLQAPLFHIRSSANSRDMYIARTLQCLRVLAEEVETDIGLCNYDHTQENVLVTIQLKMETRRIHERLGWLRLRIKIPLFIYLHLRPPTPTNGRLWIIDRIEVSLLSMDFLRANRLKLLASIVEYSTWSILALIVTHGHLLHVWRPLNYDWRQSYRFLIWETFGIRIYTSFLFFCGIAGIWWGIMIRAWLVAKKFMQDGVIIEAWWRPTPSVTVHRVLKEG